MLNFIVYTNANSGLFGLHEPMNFVLKNFHFLIDAKRLYDDLMSGYNRVVRPVSNIS